MRVRVDDYGFVPERAHATDAGMDIKACDDAVVPAHGNKVFRTGVHVELPPMTAGVLVSKSGLNVNHNITSTGLIDEGYTGEVMVKLYNYGDADYRVKRGDKISQLVVVPVWYEAVELVDELGETDRGNNGFGSTGK